MRLRSAPAAGTGPAANTIASAPSTQPATSSSASRSQSTASAPSASRSATWSGLRTSPRARSPRSASRRSSRCADLPVSSGDDDVHARRVRRRRIRVARRHGEGTREGGARRARAAERGAGRMAAAAAGACARHRGERGTRSWTDADKDGFGTAHGQASKVWLHARRRRADRGLLPEPRHARACADLELVVARRAAGRRARAARATRHAIELADPRSLSYRQVNTDRQGRYRIDEDVHHRPAARRRAGRACASSRCSGKPHRVLRPVRPRAAATRGGDDRAASSRRRAGRTRPHVARAPLLARPALQAQPQRLPRPQRRLARPAPRRAPGPATTGRAGKGNVVQTAPDGARPAARGAARA